MTTNIQKTTDLLSTIAGHSNALMTSSSPWLKGARKKALEQFESLGFPTTKLENWRYTNVSRISKSRFQLSPGYASNGLTPARLRGLMAAMGDGHTLVFVNGHFAEDLSRIDRLPEDVIVRSLAESLESDRESLEPHLNRIAVEKDQAFTALNTALLHDGAWIEIPQGTVVAEPIQLVYLSTPGERTPFMSHVRNLIVAGANSQATIIEVYKGMGAAASFTNTVTEVAGGENASIDHYKIQNESDDDCHMGSIQVKMARNATFTSHAISMGAALSRTDLGVVMNAPGGDCTLNGLYVVSDSQHVDSHTVVDHAGPHCSSRELYKGVLSGRARGVVDGKVIVRPDSQKTDARQVNNNLLLSDNALVDTKPQLEINADDVKCAHAATIGQLDQDALFYMRARAIGFEEARHILIRGFVNDMLERIRVEPLKAGLEDLLYRKLDSASGTETIS